MKITKEPENVNTPRKLRKRKLIIIVSLSLLLIIVAIGLVSVLYVDSLLSKVNYAASNPSTTSVVPEESSPNTTANSDPSVINSANASIEDNLKNNSTTLKYDNDVLNILLVGCDSRDSSNTGRSDSMILLSINKKSNRVILTSIMRDIYAYVPGSGNTRINAAYAIGGPDLLLETLKQNFKVNVDKYVTINFFTFIDIIDSLGGVTISVTDDELPVLNRYINEINKLKNYPLDSGLLLAAGENLQLTGKQALGYARIRYIGNADFQRTERQRSVLLQLKSKLASQNVFALNSMLNKILPDVTTNLSKGELYSLILSFPELSSFTIAQDRIPIDGSWSDALISGMDVLSIDFERNIAELQKQIYGS